jgi:NADH-quinone oxidoreductase subunit G
MVKKARKGVMEMLLINHPLDCPICDQGGECDLQDQAMGFGFDRSRYHENKRAVPDKELGPLVKTSMNRCIQCTRRVRFGEEIAGQADLGLLNRGEDAEIGTFIEKMVSSELSGNLVDVCPVGALTSKPYAFTARPWELVKTESIDVHDAVGSNIRVDSRSGEVLRVLPRLHEDVNEEWISDKTRHACDGLKRARLDRPYLRDEQTGRMREANWEEALALAAAKLKKAKPESTAAFVGDLCDLESIVALKDLMTAAGGAHFECRTDGSRYPIAERGDYLFNTHIAGIEQADAILLIGTDPRREAPLINARIRKAWRAHPVKIGLVGAPADLTYPYAHIGADPAALQSLAEGGHNFAKVLKGAKNPMLILGTGALMREDGAEIHALARRIADGFNMVREDWNGCNVLHLAASRVGALDVGFHGGDTETDFAGLKLVYLLGADELDMAKIPAKAFVIYQGHHGDAGAARADLILPGAAYTEKDGLYVNTEGRVQVARRAVFPRGDAREDWKILRAIAGQMGAALPYADILTLRARIAAEWPHLGEIDVVRHARMGKARAGGKPGRAAFTLPVTNFYMTNAICRASDTMAKCVEAFLGGARQLEAAE